MAVFFVGMAFTCCSGTDQPEIPDVFPDEPEHKVHEPYKVETRKNSTTGTWTVNQAWTVDCLEGFTPGAGEPATDRFGGWKVGTHTATGFFRVEKIDGRWWMITPDGNLFLSKGICTFSTGNSDRSKSELTVRYGSRAAWARIEGNKLKSYGFNSVGAWSRHDEIMALSNSDKIPYCVLVNPMGTLNGAIKSSGAEAAGYAAAGWEGYPYDFACIFHPDFDKYVEEKVSTIAKYANDPYCIGYFSDNEIPWKQYALDRCLEKWPAGHVNHDKAQEWLDARKGHSGAKLSEANDDDRKAFIAYCLDYYLSKVSTAIRKYAPNQLFLGCRFNQWNYELVNDKIFEVAGKYMDVISINHYQRWQPDETYTRNWEAWSGKPFMVTEYYVKGEDSGLPNATGAGWNVRTQRERGYFFQNFTRVLIKSRNCVGWHWFKYMDNDPEDLTADSSNRDSNKGIVKWNYDPWTPLIESMTQFNAEVYNLTKYYDNKK